MLVGARLDLLGGWNRTDSGFGVLVLLFFVTPPATAILLVVEAIQYRKGARRENAARSFFMPGLAIFLFLEALALDLYILSQLRMH